tara:strand:- start:4132 stop:4581 length:450 start_codon:yes stop_codon:yes gene_type:complete
VREAVVRLIYKSIQPPLPQGGFLYLFIYIIDTNGSLPLYIKARGPVGANLPFSSLDGRKCLMPQVSSRRERVYPALPIEKRVANWIRRVNRGLEKGGFQKPYLCQIRLKLGLALGLPENDRWVRLNEENVLIHVSTDTVLGDLNGRKPQ